MDLPHQTRYALFFSLIWFLVVPMTTGVVVNRTIDDTYGDSENGKKVTYLPVTNVWDSPNCARCVIKPDTSQAFKNTYMAATHDPGDDPISIEMEFEGIAIWVFFIIANDAGAGVTTLTNVNFTLDGGTPIPYQHIPDLTTKDIQYNQLAFSQTNLANVKHRLIISVAENGNSFVNFDYAIYTHDDGGQSPPPVGQPVSSTSALTEPAPVPLSITSSPTMPQSSSSAGSSSATFSGVASSRAASSNATSSSATPSGGPSNNRTTPVVVIAGGAMGGIAGAVLLFFLATYLMRGRSCGVGLGSKYCTTNDPVVTPFYHPNAGLATSHINTVSISEDSPSESTQPSGATGANDMSTKEMRDQPRVISSQLACLRNHQQSALALGLSDDPPEYENMAIYSPPHSLQLQSHS